MRNGTAAGRERRGGEGLTARRPRFLLASGEGDGRAAALASETGRARAAQRDDLGSSSLPVRGMSGAAASGSKMGRVRAREQDGGATASASETGRRGWREQDRRRRARRGSGSS